MVDGHSSQAGAGCKCLMLAMARIAQVTYLKGVESLLRFAAPELPHQHLYIAV